MGAPTWTRVAVGAALLLLLLIPAASAHAWLLSSVPGPSSHVEVAPDRLALEFTENIEHEYTRVEVFDNNGTRVDENDLHFDDANHARIDIGLPDLRDGVYLVRWYALSVDSHTTQGTFLFAVGSASLQNAPAPTSEHVHPTGGVPMWLEGLGRTLFYAGLSAAIGVPTFLLFVDGSVTPEAGRKRLLLTTIALLGLAIVGAGIVVAAFAQRIGTSMTDVFGSPFGSVGWYLTVRFGLVVVAAALGIVASSRPQARPVLGALGAAGVLAVWFSSRSSHAASLSHGALVATLLDFVHLVAGSMWLGGVFAFLFIARRKSGDVLGRLIGRFSPLALTSVGLIIATGVYAGLLHLQSWHELFDTRYGSMVAIKAALMLPLIALGAYNRYVLKPRAADASTSRRLISALVLETVCMVGILLAAGALATTAPPGAPGSGPTTAGPDSLEFSKQLKTAHLVFLVGPAPIHVGAQNFTAQLHAFSGSNPNGTQVFFQLAAPGESKNEELHFMQRSSESEWRLDGAYLTFKGRWSIYVTVQRPDEYATALFEVDVQ